MLSCMDGCGRRRCRRNVRHSAVAAPPDRPPPAPPPAAQPAVPRHEQRRIAEVARGQGRCGPRQAAEAKLERVTFADLPGWERRRSPGGVQDIPEIVRGRSRKAGSQAGGQQAVVAMQGAGRPISPPSAAPPRSWRRRRAASAKAFFETQFVPHRIAHRGRQGHADRLLRAGARGLAHAGRQVPDADLQAPARSRERRRRGRARVQAATALTHVRKTATGDSAVSDARRDRTGRARRSGPGARSTSTTRSMSSSCTSRARPASSSRRHDRAPQLRRQERASLHLDRPLPDRQRSARRPTRSRCRRWGSGCAPTRSAAARSCGRTRRSSSSASSRHRAAKARWEPCTVTLTPGRSLAVDTGYHTLGTPVYVSAPSLKHATKDSGL